MIRTLSCGQADLEKVWGMIGGQEDCFNHKTLRSRDDQVLTIASVKNRWYSLLTYH